MCEEILVENSLMLSAEQKHQWNKKASWSYEKSMWETYGSS